MCDKLEQRRQRFIEMSRERHGDKYDYSLVQFSHEKHCKVSIICPTHGVFQQLASTHIAKRRNKSGYMGCRKCGTDARPRKQLCVDCGGWNKYGGAEMRCKECKARHKQSKKQRLQTKYACRECGRYTGSRHRLFCSRECQVVKNRIVVHCGHCKAEIVKRSRDVRRSDKLFCNPECQRLGQIGNVSRSKKAKRDWKIAQSARRRIKSVGYKWWRLCKRDWFTCLEIGDWDRRCGSSAAGLVKRTRSAGKPRAAKIAHNWDNALEMNISRINGVRFRGRRCKWAAKFISVASNLKTRRRYVEGKD